MDYGQDNLKFRPQNNLMQFDISTAFHGSKYHVCHYLFCPETPVYYQILFDLFEETMA